MTFKRQALLGGALVAMALLVTLTALTRPQAKGPDFDFLRGAAMLWRCDVVYSDRTDRLEATHIAYRKGTDLDSLDATLRKELVPKGWTRVGGRRGQWIQYAKPIFLPPGTSSHYPALVAGTSPLVVLENKAVETVAAYWTDNASVVMVETDQRTPPKSWIDRIVPPSRPGGTTHHTSWRTASGGTISVTTTEFGA